ncbi:class D beta-lactamase [Noviherbaspirillum denitrificans]|uniref:beta-lactamase n=1 Tax=Noviherbaspirillum denitrificans TaxID=1968433 RepID=A0A254T9T4_9BURK|nr:class D beta-lactamase [Noviherbaspirillum denitrificans]OWW18062.1 class D beta-lactamase [Noviherbaspirillum denitrificans]
MSRFLLPVFCGLLLATPVARAEDAVLAGLFTQAGVKGTIVITPLEGGEAFTHEDQRSGERVPVASTFKILNTLIGLEEQAISDSDEFKWDGISREIADWNHDQTLDSAFRTSCVWCFQHIARRVGAAKYEKYLTAITYGELKRPFEETTFWLDGSLKASATEQVDLLKQIYRRSLPFRSSSYDTLRRIMLVDQTPQYAIRAKTGWATSVSPQVGWYVGYVETKEKGTWFFALNLDAASQDALPLRQKITREALQAKGIIQ